ILTLFGAKESYRSVLDMKAKQLSHSYWMFWRGKTVSDEYRRLVESTVATMRLDEDTNRAIARRVYDLIMWGELPYAEKYLDKVLEVFRNDREDKGYAATKTVMLDLHKVMAIKDEVIGFYLKTVSSNYDLALSALRVINDPYRPNEFAVTGFREVIYPKMDRARREFEELVEPGQQLPIMPMIPASSQL